MKELNLTTTSILRRQYYKFDGDEKYQTKDCEGCEFYRAIKGRGLCGGGTAFKYLFKTEKPRKCVLRNKEIPIRSARYLDEVIKKIK